MKDLLNTLVPCKCALEAIGVLTLAYVTIKLLAWFKLYFLSSNNFKRYLKSAPWAVVTGASDGIGKAFANELARRGLNVVLISRTKSKLDDVATEIEGKYKTQTKVIPFDFSTAEAREYKRLFNELDSIEVSVLINNVGINYEFPNFYEDVDIEEDMNIFKVNCEPTLRMTKYVVPQMKKRRCGAIVNLSSSSALMQPPMLTTYAATKSFNGVFGNCMNLELREHGIDVLSVTPGFVVSLMSKRKRPTFDCVAAIPMASQTLNQVGSAVQSSGHWHHGLINDVFCSLPAMFTSGKLISMMKATKRAAEKKKERDAKKE